jgi:putative ABC transport system permease protein
VVREHDGPVRRRTPLAVRLGIAAYALLLRTMPRGYRAAFGRASLADMREILMEARRFRGHTVGGTMLRACLDLIVRLPGEWMAALRPEPALNERNGAYTRLGVGERMMNVMRELRVAARTLAKRPGFATVAILTLALGIGANVAIFSIVNAVLLQPLPYEDSGQIVEFRHHAPGLDLPELMNSEGILGLYADNADFYEATAAYGRGSANLTGGDEAVRVDVVSVSPEIFDVLRVQPFMGRPFNGEDVGPGDTSPVALLMFDTWTARFGSDPGVLGRTIEMDGTSVEIVGVMPRGFAFPDPDVDLFTAMYLDPDGAFGTFGTRAVSRMVPGMTARVAQARMTEILALIPDRFEGIDAEFIESAGFSVSVETLRDRIVVDVESILWIILGTVGFVLLIACANVANLFLVRAESRQKEMAVRTAMGAGRRSVAASFMSESLLLGVGGGILGVIIANAGISALLAVSDLPRASEVTLGAAPLGLAALLSVVTGLLFGAIPMTQYARTGFAAALRDGARGSTHGRERHHARNLLVATQLALGLVLLVGSGLMLRSFAELRAVDLGIEPEGVLTLGLNRNRGEDPEIAARFFQDAADRVAALPGVAMVGVTTNLPLSSGGSNGGSFYIESRPRPEDALPPVALYHAVGPSYWSSLDIPVVAGRSMERADWEEPRAVVWVNESFADTYFDGDAVGERVAWDEGPDEEGENTPWAEIVGVVGNVREFGLADEDLRPNAYFPLLVDRTANVEITSAYLTIKMVEGQDPLSIAAGAEAAIRTLAPQVPITATRTMDEIVSDAMEATSVTMVILAIATAMALFLGAIGLAGVISYVVGQRTREIGVRVALGAEASDVSGMILRQSMMVIGAGTILGLVGAFGLTRLMEAILFEVSSTDPLTFLAAPVVLVAVSLVATWFPVRRASRVDPMEALRAE